eukprot:GEMP01023697.1.p1 GENE.GEMP01023697.1~~GEMP01023697.1.p1  ORF type:complete len:568 (+),score=75.03 GEMP01023697.1:110-1813(+)
MALGSSGVSSTLSVAKSNLDFVCAILDGDREEGLRLITAEVHEMVQSKRVDPERRRQMFVRLFRMAHFCPWKDVRTACRTLVSELRETEGLHDLLSGQLCPSRFEASDAYPIPNLDNPIWSGIFRTHVGRFLSTHWALSLHEPFLERFSATMTALMKNEGPLLTPWRNYLAIMAACRHSCESLARFQQEMFLFNGGDPQWLEDPSTVPPKLLAMEDINATLAHNPWLISAESLRPYLDPEEASLRWNIQEFLAAICVLTTHHALCSFIYGLGLLPEEHYAESGSGEGAECFIQDCDDDTLPLCFVRTLSSLRKRLDNMTGELQAKSKLRRPDGPKKEDWVNLGKLREDGATLGQEEKTALQGVMESRPTLHTPFCDHIRDGIHTAWASTFSRDAETLKNIYYDFGNHGRSPVSQFSWADHAYSILASFNPEIADCINDEVLYVAGYSDSCLAGMKVASTMPVRMAMQIYILRLYGLTRDDYCYSSLNKFLTLMNKVFLKKLACFPERITRQDYVRIRKFDGFGCSDMVQYCFAGFQSRRTVELQYLLHALSVYQATRWDDKSSDISP